MSMTIGGVDEAGRGPLAGPVVAAAVVLAPGQAIDGVRDSKQLSARRRQALFDVIRREAICFAIGAAGVAEIDDLNILHASMLAMRRAVERLEVAPERLRIDGNRAPAMPCYGGSIETVVGGDRLCPAIAAASILAKVVRDREMLRLDERFPQYGFAQHKGYPTAAHRENLRRLGPCPEHRRSFRPVRLALESTGASA
ncbi:MAG: ribonuclease HII [Gammaproteobacteria bacterium]|nr:ribonuclease HII [Gammaproteobacteria bacterium]NND35607.1 ribonuclease HII [Gammaproteobacteria bacterium]